jgi:hypothetical protein
MTKPFNKRSIGKLRRAEVRTKPKSPVAIGKLALLRSTLDEFVKQMSQNRSDEILCNIAAWNNVDSDGPYLSIEISPLFVQRTFLVPSFASFLEEEDDDREE